MLLIKFDWSEKTPSNATERRVIARIKPQRIRRSPEAARAEILQAAESALTEMSFGDLTVDVLMNRTNMTRSAFYHYFSGLDDIAVGLLDQYEQEIRAAVNAWSDGENEEGDYRGVTVKQFEQTFTTIHEHRAPFAAVIQAASGNQRVYDEWQRRIVDYFVSLTAEFIRRQVELGRSSVYDPDRIAHALVLMNDAVVNASLLQGGADSPQQLARTVSEVWNATIYGSGEGA